MMKVFEANITHLVADYLNVNLSDFPSFEMARMMS